MGNNNLNFMQQQTFCDSDFKKFRKQTRKEQFLEKMEIILIGKELAEAVKPLYPNFECAYPRPKGIERMLRIHFLLHLVQLFQPCRRGSSVGLSRSSQSYDGQKFISRTEEPRGAGGIGNRNSALVNADFTLGRTDSLAPTLVSTLQKVAKPNNKTDFYREKVK